MRRREDRGCIFPAVGHGSAGCGSWGMAKRALCLLFTPACAFSAWGDHSTGMALTVDGVMNWLVQNADALQPSMPDHYLRSNAFYALKARGEIPVAQEVPEELFLKEVLPYRVVDEPVDHWREGFFQVLAPHAMRATSLRGAVEDLVPRIFQELRASPKVMRKPNQTAVVFKSNLTPEMMAPISETLTSGYASCTGSSILIVDGLRSVGIPARLVGTPQWNIPTGGNHNWVEVWTGDGWHFFDAVPDVRLDEAWFAPSNTKFANNKDSTHAILSAEWTKGDATYPLTWRKPAVLWRAEGRTAFYLAKSEQS
ncbi:unnamed protein product [Durusdinium trenchii]|uniref:Transglutaminase-like domain-containing protein n=4 Tax=Durusdinium trenchii TaxID=1381693 RepID=A0ABP0R2Z2_9DINO